MFGEKGSVSGQVIMRFVSFMDILGFADFVDTSDLKDVVQAFQTLLSTVPLVRGLGSLPGQTHYHIKAKDPQIEIFSFSDTFILVTPDDSPKAFFEIIAATAVMSGFLFAGKLPVRGAVTCGEAEYLPGTSHLVGKALVRASKLEKEQEWFGIICDPTMLTPERASILQDKRIKQRTVDYAVPLKKTATISNPCKVINWRFNMRIQCGTASLFPECRDEEHKRKRDNTLKFCRWLRESELAYGNIQSQQGETLSVPWLEGCYSGKAHPQSQEAKHGDEY